MVQLGTNYFRLQVEGRSIRVCFLLRGIRCFYNNLVKLLKECLSIFLQSKLSVPHSLRQSLKSIREKWKKRKENLNSLKQWAANWRKKSTTIEAREKAY